MIQINLLPKEEQPSEPRLSVKLPRARFWIPLLFGVAVVLPLAGIHAMQRARIGSLRADIKTAEAEMVTLKPQIDRIRKLTAEREELALRLAVVQGLCRGRYTTVETMDNLAEEIPDYLWLTRVAQTGPAQIAVEGMAFSNLMIAELMSQMEHGGFFDAVTLVVAERAKSRAPAGRPVLSFTLNARVKS